MLKLKPKLHVAGNRRVQGKQDATRGGRHVLYQAHHASKGHGS